MLSVMIDNVGRRYKLFARLRLLCRVQIAVKTREVAARNLQSQSVSLEKNVARGPQVNGEFVYVLGLQEVRLLLRIAIAGANDSFGQILGKAI